MKTKFFLTMTIVFICGILLGLVISLYGVFGQARIGSVHDRFYQGQYINWNTGESSSGGNL